jgi:hypothetical protein
MSAVNRNGPGEVSEEDLTEWRRAALRMNAERALAELQEMASGGGGDANGAALSLVGAAIDACERVRAAATKNPSAFAPIAQKMMRWPVTHSIFPGDREGGADYLGKLQLGANAPLNLGKWRLSAPGTRWAVAFWQQVQSCCAHRDIEMKAGPCGACGGHVRLFDGLRVLRADYDEAMKLPGLTESPVILQHWREAFDRHLQRHFDGYTVVDEPDWKHLRTYRIRGEDVDLQWAYGKVLGEVGRGFQRIAKRVKPV